MKNLPTPRELDFINKYVELAVKSKTLPKNITHFKDHGDWRPYDLDIQIARCFIIVMRGWEIGLTAGYAIDEISIIEGKPTLSSKVMLAKVEEYYPYAQINFKVWNSKECIIEARKDYRQPLDIFPMTPFRFTIEDARDAKLLQKWGWMAYPRIMLKWRVVSDMCRTMFPRAILGFYTPEELGDEPQESEIAGEIAGELVFPDMEKYKQIAESKKKEPEKLLVRNSPEAGIELDKVGFVIDDKKEKPIPKKKKTSKKDVILLHKRPKISIPKKEEKPPEEPKPEKTEKEKTEKIVKSLKEIDNIKKIKETTKEDWDKKQEKIKKKPEPKSKPKFLIANQRRPKINLEKQKEKQKKEKMENEIKIAEQLIKEKGEAKPLINDKTWNKIIEKDNWLCSTTAKSKLEDDFPLEIMSIQIKKICDETENLDYVKDVLKVFKQYMVEKKRTESLSMLLSDAYYHVIEVNPEKKKFDPPKEDLLEVWNNIMRFKIGSLLKGIKSMIWYDEKLFFDEIKELTGWKDGYIKWAYKFMKKHKYISKNEDGYINLNSEAIREL
ncbi:MAG: hypothetical protein ACTSR3_01300 [Candidatus Helarchaeota archaeon]